MDKPSGWTSEWQAALIKANLEVPCFRSGISSCEFAELAGVKAGCVNEYARQGVESFKKRFGSDCSFQEVLGGRKRPFRRIYTFGGVIKPSPYKSPCPNVISPSEFVALHGINNGIEYLAKLARRGHQWFRARFPGWDFLEVEHKDSLQLVRWYGRIEDIGEQADEVLPEDNLTVSQFAYLQGLTEEGVRLTIKRGLDSFQQRFPGWSFHLDDGKPIFCRSGSGLDIFTVKQFAEQTGYSPNYIKSLVSRGLLSKKFPGWDVRPTGLKCPKKYIYKI